MGDWIWKYFKIPNPFCIWLVPSGCVIALWLWTWYMYLTGLSTTRLTRHASTDYTFRSFSFCQFDVSTWGLNSSARLLLCVLRYFLSLILLSSSSPASLTLYSLFCMSIQWGRENDNPTRGGSADGLLGIETLACSKRWYLLYNQCFASSSSFVQFFNQEQSNSSHFFSLWHTLSLSYFNPSKVKSKHKIGYIIIIILFIILFIIGAFPNIGAYCNDIKIHPR